MKGERESAFSVLMGIAAILLSVAVCWVECKESKSTRVIYGDDDRNEPSLVSMIFMNLCDDFDSYTGLI